MTATSVSGQARHGARAIQHFWTESRQSLVLCGSRTQLQPIIDNLGISHENISDLSSNRAVVALWGETLRAYQASFHTRPRR